MAKDTIPTGFRQVDRTTDPDSFMHYLRTVSALEFSQARKRHTFELLQVQKGHQVLDVGCGLGDDVVALAQLVGSHGRVVGVDSSEAMISEARRRTEGLNLPVEYRVGDAHSLDFADNTFDGCRAERIFVHLDNPRQALREMIRVVRRGAPVVVLDPDFGTLAVNSEDRAVTRTILNFLCDSLRNGWMGRCLPALFQEAALTDVAVFADTAILTDYALANEIWRLRETAERAQEAGVISAAQAASWLGELERASQAGRFFGAITVFVVSGRKP